MSDRDKVIKGLECCISDPMECGDCPYVAFGKEDDCVNEVMRDALELLKDQERKEHEARAFIIGTLF